jgi:hypothetical protein
LVEPVVIAVTDGGAELTAPNSAQAVSNVDATNSGTSPDKRAAHAKVPIRNPTAILSPPLRACRSDATPISATTVNKYLTNVIVGTGRQDSAPVGTVGQAHANTEDPMRFTIAGEDCQATGCCQ